MPLHSPGSADEGCHVRTLWCGAGTTSFRLEFAYQRRAGVIWSHLAGNALQVVKSRWRSRLKARIMTIPDTGWRVVVWLCLLGYLVYEVATERYLFHGQFGQGLDFAVMSLGFVVIFATVLYRPDALRRKRKAPWWFWSAMVAWFAWFAFCHGLEVWRSLFQDLMTPGFVVPLALFAVGSAAVLKAQPRSKASNDRGRTDNKSAR